MEKWREAREGSQGGRPGREAREGGQGGRPGREAREGGQGGMGGQVELITCLMMYTSTNV